LISTLTLVFQVIILAAYLAIFLSYLVYRAQTPPLDLELGTSTTSRV
jgi:hypothetical protein